MIEVDLYPFSYLVGAALSELPFKPLEWVAVALAIIAPVLSLTKWDDVLCRCWASFGQGYPMVKRDFVPKPFRASAYCTLIVPIFKAVFNFRMGERIGQSVFSSAAALFSGCCFMWVLRTPFALPFTAFLAVIAGILLFVFSVGLFSLTDSCSVGFAIVAAIGAVFFPVAYLIAMYGVTERLRVINPSARCARVAALFAFPEQCFSSRFSIEVFCCVGIEATACFAQFVGGWLVNHKHLTLLGSQVDCRQRAVSCACSVINLADRVIIPRGGAFCRT